VRGAVSISEHSWNVELAIPFKLLQGLQKNQLVSLNCNFGRKKAGVPIEKSAWNRVEQRLKDDRSLETLIFE